MSCIVLFTRAGTFLVQSIFDLNGYMLLFNPAMGVVYVVGGSLMVDNPLCPSVLPTMWRVGPVLIYIRWLLNRSYHHHSNTMRSSGRKGGDIELW